MLTSQPARRRRLLGLSIATLLPWLGTSAAQAQDRVWSSTATNGNWNTASNWTPANVPDQANERAVFNSSAFITGLSLANDVFIEGIVLQPGASNYTVQTSGRLLYLQGSTGVTNASASRLTLVANGGTLLFSNGPAANSVITISGQGVTSFLGSSSASTAQIAVQNDRATGGLLFRDQSTAGASAIVNKGLVQFLESSSAGNAQITNNAELTFFGSSTGGNATITTSTGARTSFIGNANGGNVRLLNEPESRLNLQGSTRSIVTVGSLAGSGFVYLGTTNLVIGGNNENTEFTGLITDAGSLTKVGSGSLILNHENIYTGGTTLQAGTLGIGNGNALGTGPLTINGGTLSDQQGEEAIRRYFPNNLLLAGNFTFAGTGAGEPGLLSTGTVNLGTGFRTINFAGGAQSGVLSFSGVVSGGALTLTASAAGDNILKLAGQVSNTFAGPLTVQENTTAVLSNGVGFAVPGNLMIEEGTVQMVGSNQQVGGSVRMFLGELDLQTNRQTINELLGGGDVTSRRAGHTTLTLGGGNFTGTFLQQPGNLLTVKITGDMRLAGSGNYTGGTIVQRAIVEVNTKDDLGAVSNSLALTDSTLLIYDNLEKTGAVQLHGNARLELENNHSLRFSGPVSGDGRLLLTGQGDFTLTGQNSYTGGTLLASTTLRINSDDSLGAAGTRLDIRNGTLVLLGDVQSRRNGMLQEAGATIDTNGFTMSQAGQLTGFGGLVKTGAGTLNLLGENRYTGLTQVSKGTLLVNGSVAGDVQVIGSYGPTLQLIQPPAISVGVRPPLLFRLVNIPPGNAATVGGSGVIGGNLYNFGGKVSPGNSPGTLTVLGNYVQSSRGVLRIELAGRGAGEFDLLQMGGRAQLDGTLHVVTLDGFRPRGSDRFTFLTAGGGTQGEFAQTVLTGLPLLRAEVEYTGRTAELTFERNTIGSLFGHAGLDDLTPNQSAVASSLDHSLNEARLTSVFDELDVLDAKAIPHALDLIAPDELSAMYEIAIGTANTQAFNLDRHLSDLRAGTRGFSAGRLSLGQAPVAEKNILEPDGKTDAKADVFAPTEDNPWSTFLAGSGEFTNIEGDGNAREGYDITTGGFTLGASYRVAPGLAVGGFVGYAGTGAELAGDGHILVNSGQAGLYATAFGDSWYVQGMVAGGYNSYDTKRENLGGSSRGDTDGGEFSGLLTGGYDFHAGAVSFGPVAEGSYTRVAYSGFRERGAAAPLGIEGNESDSLRTRLGAHLAWACQPCPRVQIRPELTLTWQREWADRSRPTDATFAGSDAPAFRVKGPRQGRDALVVNASAGVSLSNRCSTYLAYDGILGRDRYQTHTVSGGLRVSF